MQRVHFIAICDSALHNIAIAISQKDNFLVTGSDVEFSEPSLTKLKKHRLLPEKAGWFPDRINKGLHAIIIGLNVAIDNPELMRAKELKLKIYSFPEFLFQQTRSKTRIVVGGSNAKTFTTAMILFVLKQLKIDADYMIDNQIDSVESKVKLSYESRIAVFEGNENSTSNLDNKPQFHYYKPHIAILTGISENKNETMTSFEDYVEKFRKFTELMEVQGRLIYLEDDENLNKIALKLRRDIVPFTFKTADHEIIDNIVFLKTRYGNIPLKIAGDINLQYLDAARLACRQIGVTDEQFYSVISEFTYL